MAYDLNWVPGTDLVRRIQAEAAGADLVMLGIPKRLTCDPKRIAREVERAEQETGARIRVTRHFGLFDHTRVP